MVVGPFRQQKVGHRCTLLRVILQPDPSLSAPPTYNPVSAGGGWCHVCRPQAVGWCTVYHTYFCRSIMPHLFSFFWIVCGSVLPLFAVSWSTHLCYTLLPLFWSPFPRGLRLTWQLLINAGFCWLHYRRWGRLESLQNRTLHHDCYHYCCCYY